MEILGSKNPARDWPRRLVLGLAALQLADAIGNALVSRRYLSAHLDHLGVPNCLRPALPVIKVAGSAGLVVGIKLPRLGAATAACLVGYYAAAVVFHMRADDHPVVWLPAIAFGATAATSLVTFYAPKAHQRVTELGPWECEIPLVSYGVFAYDTNTCSLHSKQSQSSVRSSTRRKRRG